MSFKDELTKNPGLTKAVLKDHFHDFNAINLNHPTIKNLVVTSPHDTDDERLQHGLQLTESAHRISVVSEKRGLFGFGLFDRPAQEKPAAQPAPDNSVKPGPRKP